MARASDMETCFFTITKHDEARTMVHRWQAAFDPQASEPNDNLKTHAVHAALLPSGSLGAVL